MAGRCVIIRFPLEQCQRVASRLQHFIQALHWDRGRRARNERKARIGFLKLSFLWEHRNLTLAGGTPAVPVRA